MNKPSQRGSAIIMLFIAVALFGMLAYAFTQGSRTSTSWLETEQDTAAATSSTDCQNTIDFAVKRLQTRGCGDMISYIRDGSNENANAPTDGSCSVFHTNGGGAKPCDLSIATAPDGCFGSNIPSIGTLCGDGSIFAGTRVYGSDTKKIYVSTYEQSNGMRWKTSTGIDDISIDSNSDGLVNHANRLGSLSNFPAFQICENLSIHGKTDWYLPAINELATIISNQASINANAEDGVGLAQTYFSSTETNTTTAKGYVGASFDISKTSTTPNIRCIRRDN